MTYSALIIETSLSENVFTNFGSWMNLFIHDARCKQIVVSCKSEQMLELTKHPHPKTIYVSMLDDVYASLVHGLKAVSQDDVLVIGLKEAANRQSVDAVLETLQKDPSVVWNQNIQGYDTRLLMFCVQKAIDTQLEMCTFSDAVDRFSDTAITYIKK